MTVLLELMGSICLMMWDVPNQEDGSSLAIFLTSSREYSRMKKPSRTGKADKETEPHI